MISDICAPNWRDRRTGRGRWGLYLSLRGAAVGLVALAVLPETSRAQRVPLVMQHGIRSDASTWDIATPTLETSFPVRVVARTTPWKEPFTTQAATLAAGLGTLPDTSIAIGHSAGGLVLRQSLLNGRQYKAVATIGSPHYGAPIANNVRQGNLPFVFTPTSSQLDFLQMLFWPLSWDDPQEAEALVPPVVIAESLLLLSAAGLRLFEFNASFAIWDQLRPSGPAIPAFNSSGSLVTQAAGGGVLTSVTTSIHEPNDALWRLYFSEAGMPIVDANRNALSFFGLFASMFAAGKFCYYPNYNATKCGSAAGFADLALLLQLLDLRYCYQLFVEEGASLGLMDCGASDAVVPLGNQQWGPAGFSFNRSVSGVSHTEQTSSALVVEALDRFLAREANTKRCSQGPVKSVSLAVAPGTLFPGSVKSVLVRGLDACGIPTNEASQFELISSNSSVISTAMGPSGAGQIIAHSSGSATITAIVNQHDSARVSVFVAGPEFLTVSLRLSPSGGFLPGDEVAAIADIESQSPITEIAWQIGGVPVSGGASSLMFYFTSPTEITITVRNGAGTVRTATIWAVP